MANWKVTGFETENQGALQDVCVKVFFEVKDRHFHKNGFVVGEIVLHPPNPEAFVAYKDISELQALNWVKAALGSDGVADYEMRVQAQIDKSPAQDNKLAPPWEPVSSPIVPKKKAVE